MITANATVGGSIGVVAQLMSIQAASCPVVTEQVNGVTVGTTPSGGTNNQLNQDTAGNQVGTGANPSVVANSTAVNSDGSYSLSILAEGINVISDTPISANGSLIINQPSTIAKDVVVRYVNGTLVGAVVGSEIEIPNPVAAPTLTIGVFNSLGDPVTTADFGEVLTVTLTTSIAAPTEYRFLIFKNGIQGVATVQAGNTLLYTVDSFTDIMIYAEAKDATSVAAAISVFEVSINADADANAYIVKHNALSGLVMAAVQQDVVKITYAKMKGIGTTNGSNLHAKLLACSGEVYAFTPVSSAVVSLPTIAIDWIETAIPATIVGFVVGDVSNDGVTSGAGKYLQMKRAPSDFGQNDVGADTYSRLNSYNSPGMRVGAYNGNMTNGVFFSGEYEGCNSSYGNSALNQVGLTSINRLLSTKYARFVNGFQVSERLVVSTPPPSLKYYGFAVNRDGAPETNFGRKFVGKLTMVSARCGFTANEMADWSEVWNYFQANMNN